ncbi:MAG: hypothetical protein PHW87_07830 [Methanothrix sp.]|nr:hypothetical protein [Methanothrix sp.]
MPGKTAHLDNGAAWPGRPGPTDGGHKQQPGPEPPSAALRLPGVAADSVQVLLSRRFYLK